MRAPPWERSQTLRALLVPRLKADRNPSRWRMIWVLATWKREWRRRLSGATGTGAPAGIGRGGGGAFSPASNQFRSLDFSDPMEIHSLWNGIAIIAEPST